MSKILVTRRLSEQAMQAIAASTAEIILWTEDRAADRNWILKNVAGCAGIVCLLTDKMDAEVFDAAGPSLKVLSTMSVGFDHIDLAAARSRGVKIGFTPDVLTEAVADLTVMLALMATRRGKEALLAVQSGKWPTLAWSPTLLCGPAFTQRTTLGFLGFGRISRAVLSRLLPFGPRRALYTTRTALDDEEISREMGCEVKRVDLEELAREADVLFVLCKGGEETKGLIGEQVLRSMKRTAVLVNTARGTIVDSTALALALKEGWIFGAGLDVLDGEPHIPASHPLVLEPRCVILPHIGSATTETRDEMAILAAENVVRGVHGEDLAVELKS